MLGKFNVKRKHIQESHWEWPQCHVCQDVIEPEKMANHLRHKHGQVDDSSYTLINLGVYYDYLSIIISIHQYLK